MSGLTKICEKRIKMAGRNNKYPTHVQPRLQEIEWWCREGLIEKEICIRLDVGHTAFAIYKQEYPELKESLKKGKEIADYTVEDSLYKRATGYEYKEVHIETILDKNGNPTVLRQARTITKYTPPGTTACIFWLKNRRNDKWRDKQEVQHSGEIHTWVDLMKKCEEEKEKDNKPQ